MRPENNQLGKVFLRIDVCGRAHALTTDFEYVRSVHGEPTYRVTSKLNGVRDFQSEAALAPAFMSNMERHRMFGASDARQEVFLNDFVTVNGGRTFFLRTGGELICQERAIFNPEQLP